jgi:hypothetical protein
MQVGASWRLWLLWCWLWLLWCWLWLLWCWLWLLWRLVGCCGTQVLR